MVFSSLLFVFAFFTACMVCCIPVKNIKAQNIILLCFSLIFYAWGGPALIVLLAFMTLAAYVSGLLIERRPGHKRLWLVLSLVICLGLLSFFKYTVFLLSNLRALTGFPEALPSITLPIGISFYTFQLLSYVIDTYRGEVAAQRSYWKLLLYASLFHQCIAGPIIRYKDVSAEIEARHVTRQDISRGITRFACGLAKKAILANGCAAMVSRLVPEDTAALSTTAGAGILLAAVCYMLEIYLDFSAYSDMAIGMGLMIGFHYRENFNYPYIADSVTDFWRRWHISLSSFFRDYVYIPLGGNRVSHGRHLFNLFCVWFLTGLWHGASWNFVMWGLYYLVLLILEKYLFRLKKDSHGVMRAVRTTLTLVAVCFGWMIFFYTDLSQLAVAVKGILTLNGNVFLDTATKLEFVNNLFLLAAAVLACTPIVPALGRFFERKRVSGQRMAVAVYDLVTSLIPAALMVVSTLALAGNSYNPFLYFRF